MFEELIAQGNDMIRRQEKLIGYRDFTSIPEHELVSIIEANAWRKTVEERIGTHFGVDALMRYQIFWEIHNKNIDEGKGDESSRIVTTWHRIVAYLAELEARQTAKAQS